jgi:hypothetical protein
MIICTPFVSFSGAMMKLIVPPERYVVEMWVFGVLQVFLIPRVSAPAVAGVNNWWTQWPTTI